MPPTLLLADESLTVQRVVELTFAGEGIRVVSVSDGPEAIAASAAARPDVAMVSVSLPRLDGYEVARRLRGPAQVLPVLLVAGAFDAVDDQRVRESGAAGVLHKPLEPGLVIKRVKELLGLPEAAPAATEPPPASFGRLVTPTDRLDFHTAAEREPVTAATPPVVAAAASPPPPRAEAPPAPLTARDAGEADLPASPVASAAPPPLTSSSGPAEAFAVLLADQHAAAAATASSAVELTDAAVDRLAERVADRLLQGVLGESLRRTVGEVSERLVREEIARIRAAARSRS